MDKNGDAAVVVCVAAECGGASLRKPFDCETATIFGSREISSKFSGDPVFGYRLPDTSTFTPYQFPNASLTYRNGFH